MRPLRLTMEAFGSYGKKTVVDFTELGERSFFLIHGRTGSGKTTLLDAICFAFYGEASMAGRTGTMMRTDEAPREARTSVDFVFALGTQKYHICRTPSYERMKKDGTGLTPVQASAMLWQVEEGEAAENEERVLAQRPSSVTQKMTELLGFGPAEFRQVVLLPQGAFRDLLTAKVDEREALLAMLFKTERYRRLEELFKSRAKAMEARRAEIKAQEGALLAGGAADSLDAHRAASEEKEKTLAVLEKQAAALQEKQEAAQRAEQEGIRAAEILTRWEKARKTLADHEKKRGSVERYRAQLEEAQRAAQIEDVAAGAARDREKAKEREAECAAQEKRREKAAHELKRAEDALVHEKAREGELEEGKAKVRKLEEYGACAIDLAQARARAKSREEAAHEAAEKAAQAKAAQEKLAAELLALGTREKELAERAAKAEGLSLALAQKEKEREERQNLALLQKRAAKAQEAAESAGEKARAAREEHETKRRNQRALEHVYMEGQAALLARSLEDGEACPVCGSTAHPHPTVSKDEVPEKADVERMRSEAEKAEKAREQAEKARTAAEADLAAVRGELAAAQKSLTQTTEDEGSLAAAIASLQAEVKAAGQAAAAQKAAAAERETLAARLAQAEAAEKEAAKGAEAAKGEAAQAAGALQEKSASLPEAYREPKAVETALAAARRGIAEREKALAAAQDAFSGAGKELAAAKAAAEAAKTAAALAQEEALKSAAVLAERLKSAGFSDEAAFRAVLTGRFATAEGRKEVSDRIRAYEDKRTAFAEAEKKAAEEAAGIAPPDLAKLKAAREEAAAAWTAGMREAAALAQELKERRSREEQLEKLTLEAASLEAAYHTTGRLAEVAAGQNAHRMHFQTYVLRSILADVADAANMRLLRMTHGQYRLERKEGVADMRRSAGLDLEIFDENTGYARPMATLSGGESFLAALALALGLADVVTNYAGGIRLDTIFIDEGFGTLDAETLDLAIKTLMDLQKGGRLVGIISHVEELKNRIDVRLEVEKGEDGSTARFVVG